MEHYNSQISGWLKTSGNSLLDTLPSGIPFWRLVDCKPSGYLTAYVSTAEGSFKPLNESGNWYGVTLDVSIAEKQSNETPIYECSRLCQNTPIWNMNKLPEQFRTAIYNDRDLATGQFHKSQFVVECLQDLGLSKQASGIYCPSRRTCGGVVVLNPQAVSIEIYYTGQSPPMG